MKFFKLALSSRDMKDSAFWISLKFLLVIFESVSFTAALERSLSD